MKHSTDLTEFKKEIKLKIYKKKNLPNDPLFRKNSSLVNFYTFCSPFSDWKNHCEIQKILKITNSSKIMEDKIYYNKLKHCK